MLKVCTSQNIHEQATTATWKKNTETKIKDIKIQLKNKTSLLHYNLNMFHSIAGILQWWWTDFCAANMHIPSLSLPTFHALFKNSLRIFLQFNTFYFYFAIHAFFPSCVCVCVFFFIFTTMHSHVGIVFVCRLCHDLDVFPFVACDISFCVEVN